MGHAPLRPIPARPAGPVDPGAAFALVRASIPELEERSARALGLVALAGRPRSEAAIRLELGEEELALELARARKALRRSVVELGGRGWCERAERLVSDRLDGALTDSGAARLEVHLRNCPRCVEHERRLVQATDALVGTLPVAAPEPAPTAAPKPAAPAELVPATAPEPAAAPEPAPPPPPRPLAARAPRPPRAPVAQPAPSPAPQPQAAVRPQGARSRTELARATGWYVLFAIAVILALASLAVTVAGVLGAEL